MAVPSCMERIEILQVVEGVDQVKDITEKTNRKVEEGVNETQARKS